GRIPGGVLRRTPPTGRPPAHGPRPLDEPSRVVNRPVLELDQPPAAGPVGDGVDDWHRSPATAAGVPLEPCPAVVPTPAAKPRARSGPGDPIRRLLHDLQ